jgi:hypothetical protein
MYQPATVYFICDPRRSQKQPALAAIRMCLLWYNTECNSGMLLCKKNLEENRAQRVKSLFPSVVPQLSWVHG